MKWIKGRKSETHKIKKWALRRADGSFACIRQGATIPFTARELLWKSDVVVYCGSQGDHGRELRKCIEEVFAGKDVEVDWEYSGAGKYRFQVWSDRPDRLPLVALKREGV